MVGNNAEIHISGDKVYETRMTLGELEKKLGEGFIKVHRGCIVSAMAIHDITDTINLSNGESLTYTVRKKNEIIVQFHEKQKNIIDSFNGDDIPITEEEYHRYYTSFDNMPFAFTDIEMVSDTVTGADFSSTSIIYKQGETILSSAPVNAGTYTASITLGTGEGGR